MGRTLGNTNSISTTQTPQTEGKVARPGVVVAGNEEKKVELSKKVIVGVGMEVENIVRWDREGAVLVFEQTDKFLPLSEVVIGSLSRENKLRYSMAREFHEAWRGDANAKLVEEFQVNRQYVGRARDKLKIEGGKGMEVHWVRPDQIEEFRGRGWKVLEADEAKSWLGPKAGHHEIGRLGQTELVAVGLPKAEHERREKEKAQKNEAKAGMWKASGVAELRNAGGFVETEGSNKMWDEIPQ